MAKATSVDRGACIRDLSQYPGEVSRGSHAHAHTQDARTQARTWTQTHVHSHTHACTHAHTLRRSTYGCHAPLCCLTGAHTHTHTQAQTHNRTNPHKHANARALIHSTQVLALSHTLAGGVPVGAGHLRAARRGPPPGARRRRRRRRPQAPRHRHSCPPKRQRQGPHRRGDGIRICVRVCVCVCLDAGGKAVTVKAQSFPPPFPLAQVRAAQTGSANVRRS